MSSFALELNNISKRFPGVLALDGVSFNIEKGHCHAIVGENGAGKSTLINIISGVLEKSGGEILVFGERADFRNPHEAQQSGIVTIHQELSLVPDLSVMDNLFLGEEKTRGGCLLDKKQTRETAQRILDDLQIQIDVDSYIRDLSVAQCKMIEIGRAVFRESRILIMDEPTASLSEHEIQNIFGFIRQLKEKGVTIIYISHKLDELFEICDDVTVLRDGQHIFTRKIGEITKAGLVSAMINSNSLDSEYPVRDAGPVGATALSVRDVRYKNRVKGVSFEVARGEILGIFGVVGAGKTELAKSIVGEYKESGQIYLDGEELKRPTPAMTLGQRRLAYVPEDRKREGLILDLSVAKNVVITNLADICRNGLLNKARIKSRTEDYIQALKIKTPSAESAAKNLSGGNQQKVVIAKWLNSDAEVFIIDEPTVGVDVGAKLEIRKLINNLADQGKAVLLISSDLNEVCRMSDRLLVMKEGRIVAQFAKEEIDAQKVYGLAT